MVIDQSCYLQVAALVAQDRSVHRVQPAAGGVANGRGPDPDTVASSGLPGEEFLVAGAGGVVSAWEAIDREVCVEGFASVFFLSYLGYTWDLLIVGIVMFSYHLHGLRMTTVFLGTRSGSEYVY